MPKLGPAPEATSQAVSRSMKGNRGRDTRPELKLRQLLREARDVRHPGPHLVEGSDAVGAPAGDVPHHVLHRPAFRRVARHQDLPVGERADELVQLAPAELLGVQELLTPAHADPSREGTRTRGRRSPRSRRSRGRAPAGPGGAHQPRGRSRPANRVREQPFSAPCRFRGRLPAPSRDRSSAPWSAPALSRSAPA